MTLNQVICTNDQQNKAELLAKDFEDFAYIVSHDLNAPLRHLKEFTKLLIGARQVGLSDEEKEYVSFLEESLNRLDGMQRVLLAYSRINTRAGSFKPTDLNQTVANALKELSGPINDFQPLIVVGPMPVLKVDAKQIELVFFHLIDNSLKFHKQGDHREIEISSEERSNSWFFKVRDNGIGIDAKFQKEIFQIFKMLDSTSFPGAGAGLALVQKIIQRHKGEIFIESVLGQGTTICFTVSKDIS